jgi:transcriptional regulator GlxA family with amidase domain
MTEFCTPRIAAVPAFADDAGKRRRVVAVAIPGSEPLELIGPVDILMNANFLLAQSGRADLGYDIEIVTTAPGVVFEYNGLRLVADTPFESVRGDVDTLIVPPMDPDELGPNQQGFLSWIARTAKRTRRVVSICIGTYVLAEAGLLDGKRATTHWAWCDDFKKRYPNVHLQPEPIYVRDQNIYSSAGATSGLDLSLALVEEDFGRDVALRVAQFSVMYLKRPGSQAQFSVQMEAQLADKSAIRKAQEFVLEHLAIVTGVEQLAEEAAMSPRNFARVFTREVGISPGRFIELSRLERARQLLEQSTIPIAAVAKRCGYGSADAMRIAFDRHLNTGPREYRRRFSSSAAS